jgi:hypothetical protein
MNGREERRRGERGLGKGRRREEKGAREREEEGGKGG